MSLIKQCLKACDDIGLPRPQSIAGNLDQLARLLLSKANNSLDTVSNGKNWPCLKINAVLNLTPGVSLYPTPLDLNYIIADTESANNIPYGGNNILNGLTPSHWKTIVRGERYLYGSYAIRLIGAPAQFEVYPTPSSAETIHYEYQTKWLATNTSGERVPEYSIDTDTSIIPERLIGLDLLWRIKAAKGLGYAEEYNEAMNEINMAFARAEGASSITIGRNSYYDEYLGLNIPRIAGQ